MRGELAVGDGTGQVDGVVELECADEPADGRHVGVRRRRADDAQHRCRVVDAAIHGERLHQVVLRLVGRDAPHEQPHRAVVLEAFGGVEVDGPVELVDVEQDRRHCRAHAAQVEQLLRVVLRVTDAERGAGRELGELVARPCRSRHDRRLPAGPEVRGRDVVVIERQPRPLVAHEVGHAGADGDVVEQDVVGSWPVGAEVLRLAGHRRADVLGVRLRRHAHVVEQAPHLQQVAADRARLERRHELVDRGHPPIAPSTSSPKRLRFVARSKSASRRSPAATSEERSAASLTTRCTAAAIVAGALSRSSTPP